MIIPADDMLTTEEALTAVMVIFAQRGRAIREAQQRQHSHAPSVSDSIMSDQSSHIVEPANDQVSLELSRM